MGVGMLLKQLQAAWVTLIFPFSILIYISCL